MKIAICISTFNRPQGLHQLLRSLAAITAPTGADITCVIVNNDPDDNSPRHRIRSSSMVPLPHQRAP